MIRAALLTLALAQPAGAFELAFPVDCELGSTCHIQNYVDHSPSPTAQDFTCAGLTYDGHDGTDIALPTHAAMQAGVNVLAAAPGTVKGVRDGVADFAPVVEGKECGNGVVIDHGDGWQTQYCHLKQGSVVVKPGETLAQGAVLGQIGQSGMAAFPHLHLALRQNGDELDPFAPSLTTCGSGDSDLWSPDIAYAPGGLLDVGLTNAVPDYDAIKAGLPSPDLPTTAPALVIWAYVYGTRPGDALLLTISGPEGQIITERVVFEKPQAQAFRAVGRKLKSTGWPAGTYIGQARLMRSTTELGSKTIIIQVIP